VVPVGSGATFGRHHAIPCLPVVRVTFISNLAEHLISERARHLCTDVVFWYIAYQSTEPRATPLCLCIACLSRTVWGFPITRRLISHRTITLLANSAEFVLHLPILDCWKDTSVDESKCVPLSRTLRLEVPPEPTLGLTLKGGDLSLDVTSAVVFVGG
jgi:hypothetical protein